MKYIKKYSLFEAKIDTDDFEYVKDLGGSTGAYMYIDKSTDQLWVVKFGANINHMYNEYLANKMYTKFGINVPEAFIGEVEGEEALITKYLEDSIPLANAKKHIVDEVSKGFLFDVLFANWDVVGSEDTLDNIRITPDGKVWRVDLGGSLLYRAMGGKKEDMFSEIPTEHITFKDPKTENTYDVFKNVTTDDIRRTIKEETKKYVVNDKISYVKFLKDIKELVWDEDNKLSEADKKEVYRKICKRAFNLYNIFN